MLETDAVELRALLQHLHIAGDLPCDSHDPSDYIQSAWSIEAWEYACQATPYLGNRRSRLALEALRTLGLMAQSKDQAHPRFQRETAYGWVRVLVDPEGSSDFFFLQRYRTNDAVFYRGQDGATNLQPKARADWSEAWRHKLAFIKPQDLTVTELELALTIFDWNDKEPKFVWWLREEPHLLWRVHLFLLNRYCFQLLRHFEIAAERDGLDKAPFRAGEGIGLVGQSSWFMISPRLIGLTAIGYLGVVSVDAFVNFFFHAPEWMVASVALAAYFAGYWLYRLDVFKQNRGVLADEEHAKQRIRIIWKLASTWSLIVSAGLWFIWWGGDEHPFVRPSWPADVRYTLSMIVRWPALALSAIVLGAVVQWFWQDESAIDPI